MRVFVAINLWVCRLDQQDPDKSRSAAVWLRELADRDDIVISTRVLIELRAVLTGKPRLALSARDAMAALESLAAFEVAAMVLDAHVLAEAEQLSRFDALIAEAAQPPLVEVAGGVAR